MHQSLKVFFNSFVNLFYPELCAACERVLLIDEEQICLDCQASLPGTGFHWQEGNPLEKIFWGRFPVQSAGASYYFRKGGKVQTLLHNIKYKGMKEAAEKVGLWYGAELKCCARFGQPELIIPVPLHKKKQRKRGFNQSEWFARGLSASLAISTSTNNLVRIKNTETQTKKGRLMRWQNVADVFLVNNPAELAGKHILLVDDVVTTGATLEACAQTLLGLNCGLKISIATIAFAT